MANQDNFGDERLRKNSGATTRGARDGADMDRVHTDGLSLSSEERKAQLRQGWVQNILPTPPTIPGFHCCWLSTTNATDPIYRRVQRGYIPVKATEIPGFGAQYVAQGGEFDGCVACSEMLLFKIDERTYQDLMTIFHHDMPLEQEDSIREKINAQSPQDSNGRNLGIVEGSFNSMGSAQPRSPTFN